MDKYEIVELHVQGIPCSILVHNIVYFHTEINTGKTVLHLCNEYNIIVDEAYSRVLEILKALSM